MKEYVVSLNIRIRKSKFLSKNQRHNIKDKPNQTKRHVLCQCDQVPTPTPTRLFSFMNPLAVEIWLFLLLAYVLVSLSMWVVARFTPYEWHDNVNGSGATNRCHHCHHYLSGSIGGINQIMQHQHNPDVMMASEQPVLASSNDFSLANSFWFTIGTLMQQGSDLNPKVFGYLPSILPGRPWLFVSNSSIGRSSGIVRLFPPLHIPPSFFNYRAHFLFPFNFFVLFFLLRVPTAFYISHFPRPEKSG